MVSKPRFNVGQVVIATRAEWNMAEAPIKIDEIAVSEKEIPEWGMFLYRSNGDSYRESELRPLSEEEAGQRERDG